MIPQMPFTLNDFVSKLDMGFSRFLNFLFSFRGRLCMLSGWKGSEDWRERNKKEA